jgi:DNA (cytosine-5)-methyltransferase 1
MNALAQQQRRVPVVVVENVTGALTANGGRDFIAILDCITRSGYLAGAVVIDAVHFVPQSRPRLFIVAVAAASGVPELLLTPGPCAPWHTSALRTAHARLPRRVMEKWLWWKLPTPPPRRTQFADVLDRAPQGMAWHSAEKTLRLLALMSEANMAKVREAQCAGRCVVGTVYKRMRAENGKKVQRAEARFDQISGCLRTPAGGSSRQSVLVIEGDNIRSRLLSGREAARLMGLPETYRLPEKYNEAYHVAGDGVVVPAVAWLERRLLHPLATVIDSKTFSTCSDSVSCCS